MYLYIGFAIVAVLSVILAAGIWWERAAARRKRALHARRQVRRKAKAWAYFWVFGRDRNKRLTHRPREAEDERP